MIRTMFRLMSGGLVIMLVIMMGGTTDASEQSGVPPLYLPLIMVSPDSRFIPPADTSLPAPVPQYNSAPDFAQLEQSFDDLTELLELFLR